MRQIARYRALTIALTIAAFFGTIAVAGAFHDEPVASTGSPVGFWNPGAESAAHAFFPWVPNGSMLDGTGPYYGTLTVQNLEDEPAEIDFFVGIGASDENWELIETIDLQPKESQTMTASSLGIDEPGASVVAAGYLNRGADGYEDPNAVPTVVPADPATYARIAAVVKNVSPTPGHGAATNSGHVTVDGYSALQQEHVENLGNSRFVLPIVQTNNGWDTRVTVANFNEEGNSIENVSITTHGSTRQGYAGEQVSTLVNVRPGGTASFYLSEIVEEGWVGSAYIESSADIGVVAERVKAENDMLITNVSDREVGVQKRREEGMTSYAPLVFKDYNFWNTGISVVNTDPSRTNQVTITYYGPTNNQVAVDTMQIPPRGMEYVFTRGNQNLGLDSGYVGSARITGSTTFHAAVDQVKYYGDDRETGQAMSYIVPKDAAGPPLENGVVGDVGAESDTGVDYDPELQAPDVTSSLVFPLVQKGNSEFGTGDSSGIQLFNTLLQDSYDLEIVFYGANGNPVGPTVENNDPDPIQVTLAGNTNYTLYTHEIGELANGFRGSVVIEVVGSSASPYGPPGGMFGIVGVSNNVNYDVNGDGAVTFMGIVIEPDLPT